MCEISFKEVEPIDNESDMCGMRKERERKPRAPEAVTACGALPLKKKGMCSI